MNELQKWALAKGTTPEELKILTLARTEPSAIRDQLMGQLAKYENGDAALSDGKDTAISMMLDEGRNGNITVKTEDVMAVTGAARDAIPVKTDEFASNLLPGIIASLNHGVSVPATEIESEPEPAPDATEPGDESEFVPVPEPDNESDTPDIEHESKPTPDAAPAPEADAEPAPEPELEKAPEKPKRRARAAANNAEKPAPRRKTKFSINKAVAANLFQTGAETSGRGLRAFLLSLPDYKPQDVALMSDAEVTAIFENNFIAIAANNGTMVLSKTAYSELLACLISNDAYFIPDDDAASEE